MSLRRPSAATVLASLALFVALGGVSAAQDAVTSAAKKISGATIKDRTIKARQIANSAITTTQIKNGTIAAGDLNAALTTQLAKVGAPGPKGDTGAPGPNVVPADGVIAAGVKDGSLSARDVGRYATTLNDLPFGIVNNGTCSSITSTSLTPIATGAGEDLRDDGLVVTPTAAFPLNAPLTLHAQATSANQVAVTICNISAAPVNVGTRSFRLVSIDIG
jgi:hypothetical protein